MKISTLLTPRLYQSRKHHGIAMFSTLLQDCKHLFTKVCNITMASTLEGDGKFHTL